ncbi:MAG: hypothetical protein JW748_00100 [Anaerolineales bacterium]|nr:hypothetical protein [Anaerolineales bacterium]
MFFNGGFFWFLMGILSVVVVAAFRAFARDRGWRIAWWKGLFGIAAYFVFAMSFYAWGTLIGEGEGGAGFRILVLGIVISLALGAGFWKLITAKPAD